MTPVSTGLGFGSRGAAATVLAIFAAAVVAWLAWRRGSLSRNGAVVAALVGAVTMAASVPLGVYLLAWFASSSALSRWRRIEKERRTASIAAKGDRRDAWQVLANGGVTTACALLLLSGMSEPALLLAAGAGALAAAGADTWGTEIGVALGGTPRTVHRWQPVPPGTSGAVSLAGSLGSLLGAALFGLLAVACGVVPPTHGVAVATGGVAGALLDTFAGALLQERRWCATCDHPTERRVHGCGAITAHAGGLRGVTNDGVNLLATVVGAGVTAWMVTSS